MSIWKKVPGFSDYEISESGDIRKSLDYIKPTNGLGSGMILPPGQMLKKQIRTGGYHKVVIKNDNGTFQPMDIHVLVALTFIGARPFKKAIVRHWDDNRLNNHYSNLRWGTYSDNMRDAERNGKRNKPSPNAKLSHEDVKNIKALYQSGSARQKIAEVYKVHRETIGRIIRNEMYKDVS